MDYQSGVFTDRGYIAYVGTVNLEELMAEGRWISASGDRRFRWRNGMIQLFMKRSGSSVIVPLRFPASQSAITEAPASSMRPAEKEKQRSSRSKA